MSAGCKGVHCWRTDRGEDPCHGPCCRCCFCGRENVRRLETPIPARGKQGLWRVEVPEEVLRG